MTQPGRDTTLRFAQGFCVRPAVEGHWLRNDAPPADGIARERCCGDRLDCTCRQVADNASARTTLAHSNTIRCRRNPATHAVSETHDAGGGLELKDTRVAC